MAGKVNKTILIDKDGVLNMYCGWTGKFEEYPIRDGVKEFLKLLQIIGWTMWLFTSSPKKSSKKWLKENGIDHYFKGITNRKIPATIYLDDRAICFKGDFWRTYETIQNFRAFWEKSGKDDGWTK